MPFARPGEDVTRFINSVVPASYDDVPFRASDTNHITRYFRAVVTVVWRPRSILLNTSNTTFTQYIWTAVFDYLSL